MTPARQAKAYGLDSLKELQEHAGLSRNAIVHLAKTHPYRFKLLCFGLRALKDEKAQSSNSSETSLRTL